MEFDERLKRLYSKLAKEFKPMKIKTLFVGESFPINGSYFYWPKNRCSPLAELIFKKSLRRVPKNNNQYLSFLMQLREKGIFLIDVYENPLRVRRNENRKLVERLLREKMFTRIKKLNPKRVHFILPHRDGKYEVAINQVIRRLRKELSIEGKREKSPWVKVKKKD